MKFKQFILPLFLFPLTFQNVFAQLTSNEIKEESSKELRSSLKTFREYLSIPNNGKVDEDIQANLEWCKDALESRGFNTKELKSGSVPHLFAEGTFDPKKKTILVYMQIDGQPVDSSSWNQESPYIPALKMKEGEEWEEINWNFLEGPINPEWKIFARSASDSKGPTMAFFTALDILKKTGNQPSVNLKFILDFQEEMSSPELADVVSQNKELFEADGILIMDGTRHISNLPNLTFGARGIATATIRVFGASNDLHSGQYGNFAPNPVFSLSRLLAAMKDEEGRVLIPNFYAGIQFSDEEINSMKKVPEDLEEIERDLGFAEAEKVGNSLQEALQFPTLNVRGLRAGWVGVEVRTLIPSEAIAEIDMRLVKETPGQRQIDLLKQFVIDQGFHLVEDEPTIEERNSYPKLASFEYRLGSDPFRAEMDSPFANWLKSGMNYVFGDEYINTRTTGGSQPMAPFINILGIPAVSVRIPNPDNSIHAPNENIRIGNYLEGIQTCLGILTQPFQ
ncbi:M20/M25/M40 family metallo-hydrolase [Algoriphagus halophilus]|uniref:M20/M25/M40 family metallo-hydrolase n=1 Tax=Algoriphagus halophilus TaxID=226505 RepID=UPI00358E19C1